MAAIGLNESDEYASRRLISFLRLPTEGGAVPPIIKRWSVSLLGEGGSPIQGWKNLDIYDIHGKLLFRDKSLPQGDSGKEFRVRTAADDMLQAPVWSVGSGTALDVPAAVKVAKAVAAQKGLKVSDDPKSLVCYSYPKLGLLCETKDGARAVFDLWEPTVVPLDKFEHVDSPEHPYCWSPYDKVSPTTVPLLKAIWKQRLTTLPQLPQRANLLQDTIKTARSGSEEATLGDSLVVIAQMHSMACVPASFAMILKYHGINVTQQQVATAMETTEEVGTFPAKQAPAINPLTGGRFYGTWEQYPTFNKGRDEIKAGRPVKEGIVGHARVLAGWRIEEDGERWAHVFDPYPANVGTPPYWEVWDTSMRVNYVYVRAPVFPG